MSTPIEARGQELTELDGAEIDVLVVGGGITGSGAARDAVYRGLRVVLAERTDFAAGTSSRSSKLVHGGLRYLEQGALGLIFEAANERLTLMRIAPHLVRPLPFLFPTYRNTGLSSRFPLAVGMVLYDALSGFNAPRLHRSRSRAGILRDEPGLRTEGLTGGSIYYDAMTDDARLTFETALDARRAGANVLNRTEVIGLERKNGHVHRAQLRCRVTGREISVQPRSVIMAVGPWANQVRERLGLTGSGSPGGEGPVVRCTRGSHAVIDHHRLPVQHAVVIHSPDDQRVMFAIPWRERTLLGTTDLDFDADPADVRAESDEVDYILTATNHQFPDAHLTRDDVLATYSGLRPLVHEPGVDPSDVTREHRIIDEGDGVITVVGGKLTTYRAMAEEIIDEAVQVIDRRGGPLRGFPVPGTPRGIQARLTSYFSSQRTTGRGATARRPLPGGVGLEPPHGPARILADLERKLGDTHAALNLIFRYGSRAYDVAELVAEDPNLGQRVSPDLGTIWAEIPFAAREEMAWTLDDVLGRRTGLVFWDRQQGTHAVDRSIELLRPLLNWSDEDVARERAAFAQTVAQSRTWAAPICAPPQDPAKV